MAISEKTKKRAEKGKILVRQVWITEKASNLSGSGKYVFIVDKSANKPEVKKAIESIYSVNVEGVNIVSGKGKSKRLGRSVGRTSEYKKAIVSLKAGQKIDVMPS
jgi:large subunit ribosomal protein L23